MMENGEWNGQEQRKRKIDLGEDKEGDKSRMVKGIFSQRAHHRPLSALFFPCSSAMWDMFDDFCSRARREKHKKF